jgi:hypothetical protein
MLSELTKERTGKQTNEHYFDHVPVAHKTEFSILTGRRRKEATVLQFSQFVPGKMLC